MVCHEAEAIEGDLALTKVKGETFQIVFPVFIVVEDILPVIPSYDDMKECPWIFEP